MCDAILINEFLPFRALPALSLLDYKWFIVHAFTNVDSTRYKLCSSEGVNSE